MEKRKLWLARLGRTAPVNMRSGTSKHAPKTHRLLRMPVGKLKNIQFDKLAVPDMFLVS